MKSPFFLVALLVGAVSPSFASPPAPYSPTVFDAAQKGGKTVVVTLHADWCPTCRAQSAILRDLSATGATADAVYLVVDFDKDKTAVKRFRAVYQSALIVFRGTKEVARSTGETDADAIRTMIGKGL